MILPVYAFGHPVLKRKGVDISPDFENLDQIIQNMWETMYQAKGVGLAAPQIGLGIRLFIVDTIQIMEEGRQQEGIKKVFINAKVQSEFGDPWTYEEGCLSIPNIRGDVERLSKVRIQYLDEQFNPKDEIYEGINARVIQHEYDHIEGRLFVELLGPVKKKMIQRKLSDIKQGKVTADYKIKFPRIL
ncbi:MAG: peptide deformylase [Saprospiraceae bacterium]